MRRTTVLLLLLLLPSCVSARAPERPSIRFDGLYQTVVPDEDLVTTHAYLRFYPDGTVMAVTSTGTPRDLRRWFRKQDIERLDQSHGTWSRTGNTVRFSTTSSHGTVDSEGAVAERSLAVTWHSHINGRRGEESYRFVAWDELPDSGA